MATKGYHHMTLDQTLPYSDIAVKGKIAEQHCAGTWSKQIDDFPGDCSEFRLSMVYFHGSGKAFC